MQKPYLIGGFSKNSHIYIHNCMMMGEIVKLYPTAQDSLDESLFDAFEKVFNNHRAKMATENRDQYNKSLFPYRKQLLDSLKKTNHYTIILEDAQDILCTVLDCYGKNYVVSAYGHQYHIVLEQGEKWYGCNIEHRFPLYSVGEHLKLNPSSWMVNNRKFPWTLKSLPEQDTVKEEEVVVPGKLSLAGRYGR